MATRSNSIVNMDSVNGYNSSTKTDDQIQNELDNLISNISKDVMNSTVNKSIKEASRTINQHAPAFDSLINNLKEERIQLSRVKSQLENSFTNLRKLDPEFINQNLVEINDEISVINHHLDGLEIMQNESEGVFLRKINLLEEEMRRLHNIQIDKTKYEMKKEFHDLQELMIISLVTLGVVVSSVIYFF